jgi:hypothetical protein
MKPFSIIFWFIISIFNCPLNAMEPPESASSEEATIGMYETPFYNADGSFNIHPSLVASTIQKIVLEGVLEDAIHEPLERKVSKLRLSDPKKYEDVALYTFYKTSDDIAKKDMAVFFDINFDDAKKDIKKLTRETVSEEMQRIITHKYVAMAAGIIGAIITATSGPLITYFTVMNNSTSI